MINEWANMLHDMHDIMINFTCYLLTSGSGSERFLVSFALRDSPDALINCTCWGNEGFITNLAQSFNIGDIGEI